MRTCKALVVWTVGTDNPNDLCIITNFCCDLHCAGIQRFDAGIKPRCGGS